MENTDSGDIVHVVFDSNYKGKIRDCFSEILSAFLSWLFGSIAILAIGIYIAFPSCTRSVVSTMEYIIGILFYFLACLGLLLAFIVPLFRVKNKGFKGKIEITIRADEHTYEITTFKNHGSFHEKANICSLHIKKRTILFGKDFANYRIPKRFLSKEQIEIIHNIKTAMNQAALENSKQKRK